MHWKQSPSLGNARPRFRHSKTHVQAKRFLIKVDWLTLVGLVGAQIPGVLALVGSARSRIRSSEIEHFDFWYRSKVSNLTSSLQNTLQNQNSQFVALPSLVFRRQQSPIRICLEEIQPLLNQIDSLLEDARNEFYSILTSKKYNLKSLDYVHTDATEQLFAQIQKSSDELVASIIDQQDPNITLGYGIAYERSIRIYIGEIRKSLSTSKKLFRFLILRSNYKESLPGLPARYYS